jgi:hypothetical protein
MIDLKFYSNRIFSALSSLMMISSLNSEICGLPSLELWCYRLRAAGLTTPPTADLLVFKLPSEPGIAPDYELATNSYL